VQELEPEGVLEAGDPSAHRGRRQVQGERSLLEAAGGGDFGEHGDVVEVEGHD
jgi:hypothetical protein